MRSNEGKTLLFKQQIMQPHLLYERMLNQQLIQAHLLCDQILGPSRHQFHPPHYHQGRHLLAHRPLKAGMEVKEAPKAVEGRFFTQEVRLRLRNPLLLLFASLVLSQ